MIISVSGKINSGKDTVGKIIQILTKSPHFTDEAVVKFLERNVPNPVFTIHKWADTLKDIVCLLIGCTRADLEDREFKERKLGEEWWYYKIYESQVKGFVLYPYLENKDEYHIVALVKLTPRLLLQLLGTECGRQIIHPNIWVNALMSEYKPLVSTQGVIMNLGMSTSQLEKVGKEVPIEYPNWVITDTRFPNELKAVKDKGGITIRVNRKPEGKWIDKQEWDLHTKGIVPHESETALDNAEFDYVIDNNGSIEELVEKVREILTKENFV